MNILGQASDAVLDTFCEKVAKQFNVDACVVSLVLEDRLWFKSSFGYPADLSQIRETPRDTSFCTHVVEIQRPLIVKEVSKDHRFANNPLVKKYSFCFYAGAPLRTSQGHVLGSLCLYHNKPKEFSKREVELLELFSERVMAHLELNKGMEWDRTQETLARLASFPELNPGPIIEVGLDGLVYYLNPKAARSLPDIQEEGLQHPFLEGLQSVAAALQNGEKGSFVREVQVGSVWYEQVMHYVDENKRIRVYARDISDRKRAEEALAEQAIRDTLTGLYNRRYFNHRILEEIAQAKRNNHTLAILICDLDHFKTINETRGHQTGDEVLKAVAKSIQDSTRGTDLVFRWAGDEIVVVLSDADREGGLIVADRIRTGVQKINQEVGFDLDLSVGMALCPEHGNNAPELIHVAERALYIAKKSEDKIHIGEQEYHLDEHSIKIVFQPIMNVRSQEVLGYEALGRDPQGKMSILDLFKKYQAIGQLTELKSICVKSALKAAQQVGLKRVFINTDFNLLSHLQAVPKPTGMEVILEISELEALHEIENRLKIARKWREQGYKFAIDDFGAGFISLPFVAQLTPEYIKLDRSTMLQTVASEQFKEFMIGLVFGLRNYASEGIIAEGIETEKELKIIKDVGIYLIQGFLFGKPQELK